jgi:hypothetical protein
MGPQTYLLTPLSTPRFMNRGVGGPFQSDHAYDQSSLQFKDRGCRRSLVDPERHAISQARRR